MIVNAIEFHHPHSDIVDAFNVRSQQSKVGTYWNEDEVTQVRTVIKQHYVTEQSNRCCYCGIHIPTSHGRAWDVEHVVPKSTHPKFLFEPRNLAVSCIDCNMAKDNAKVLVADRTAVYPQNSDGFTIVHPHYDDIHNHIAITLGRYYLPKTRKGENTVAICRLGRYAYQELGWDDGLCDHDQLVAKCQEMLSVTDVGTQAHFLKELLMLAQIHVSRSLLPTVPNPNPPQSPREEADEFPQVPTGGA